MLKVRWTGCVHNAQPPSTFLVLTLCGMQLGHTHTHTHIQYNIAACRAHISHSFQQTHLDQTLSHKLVTAPSLTAPAAPTFRPWVCPSSTRSACFSPRSSARSPPRSHTTAAANLRVHAILRGACTRSTCRPVALPGVCMRCAAASKVQNCLPAAYSTLLTCGACTHAHAQVRTARCPTRSRHWTCCRRR